MADDLSLDIWIKAHDAYSRVFEEAGIKAKTLGGKIGLLAGGFGVLAGGVIGESIKQAAEFESKTQTLANNTNMGAAGLAAMRENALKLQSATGQNWERIAEGYMHIANHAYSGAAATNILAAATKNAAATHGDAAEDANVLAGVLREYNVSAQDLAKNTDTATRYMDVLHNAVANSNWTMGQFVEGSKRAIAQAGLYKVPLSEVAAQLAVLSEHGFPSANIASLNWAGMLRSLEFPTDKALKGIKSLSKASGVDLVADIKKLHQDGAFLPQFLSDVGRASSSAGALKAFGDQASALHAIMTQSSYRAALEALVRNHEELGRVQSVTGAAAAGKHAAGMVGTNEAFAAQQRTLEGQLKDLRGTMDSTMKTIGMALIPVLDKLLHAIVPIIQKVADWVSHHQKLAAMILGATAVLGTFVGAIMLIAPAMAAAKEVTTLWTAAQWLLNAALDANPIGLLVLGIAAAVAAAIYLVTHWKQISAMLQAVWSGIADAAGAFWQWLSGIWDGIVADAQLAWENLGEWLSGIWNGISSFAASIWNHVVDFLKGLWKDVSGVWQGLWNTIGTWLHNFWSGIVDIAKAVWGGISGFFGGLWDGISGVWSTVWNAIGSVAHGLWSGISSAATTVWKAAVATVAGLWDAVSGIWRGVWGGIKTALSTAWNAITSWAGTFWDDEVNGVKKLWDAVSGIWRGVWNTVKNALSTAWTAITNWAGTFWDDEVNGVKKLWDAVSGLWHGAWTTVKDKLSDAWNTILNWARGFWTSEVGTVVALWNVVSDRWHSAWTTVKNKFAEAWNGIKNWAHGFWTQTLNNVVGLWNGVKNAWTQKWNDIKEVLDIGHWLETTLFGKALQWGKGLIGHLVEGVKAVAHDLYEAVRNALGPIGKLFPKSPAEEGPLSVPPDFRYIGDAMRAAIPHVQRAAGDLVGAAGLGGGSLGVDVAASRLGVAAGNAALASAGHTVTIAPTINISGGTFTDQRSIQDLAHRVSEEIMHSVRLQGGLLPQI